MSGNFADLLRPKSENADADALIVQGGAISHADIDRMAARYAAALLSRGLRQGDRLASQTEKSPEALALYLACLRAGIIYVPVNTAYKRTETADILLDAEPAAVVCPSDKRQEVATIVPSAQVFTLDADGSGSIAALATDMTDELTPAPLEGESIAIIMYTSGTTGRPKGAMLSHRGLAVNARALVAAWDIRAKDRILHCLPMFHAHGLTVSTSCALAAGASMIWLPRFDRREVLDSLRACPEGS